MIGEAKQCKDVPLILDSFIERIKITYDDDGVNFFEATVDSGLTMARGKPKPNDKEYVTSYTKERVLAGFVGYEQGRISALGSYRYICDAKTEQIAMIVGNEIITIDIEPEIEIAEVEDDDQEGLKIILIVCGSLLVPLFVALCYMRLQFIKNQKAAKQSALFRSTARRSIFQSVRMQKGDLIQDRLSVSEIKRQLLFAKGPSNDEIKDLMDGKSRRQRRTLLKEISKADQHVIELEYLLQQEKDDIDEHLIRHNIKLQDIEGQTIGIQTGFVEQDMSIERPRTQHETEAEKIKNAFVQESEEIGAMVPQLPPITSQRSNRRDMFETS